ncbi:MAG TPA: hypothetical protein VFQ90_10505 [Stellaceae bacterium]|nr:hypothetical protein [Stellaceae bacterium]
MVAIDDAVWRAARRARGGNGDRIENSEKRTGALKRALETIDCGQQAFLKLISRGAGGEVPAPALQDDGAAARERFEELPKHGQLRTHFVLIFKSAICEFFNPLGVDAATSRAVKANERYCKRSLVSPLPPAGKCPTPPFECKASRRR